MRGRSAAAKPAPRRRRSSRVRCRAVLGSAHRCASLVDSAYDVSLTGRALSAASAVASAARTPATALVGAEVFVEPDTTVFRVEASRSLRVFSEYLCIDPTPGQLTAVSCR